MFGMFNLMCSQNSNIALSVLAVLAFHIIESCPLADPVGLEKIQSHPIPSRGVPRSKPQNKSEEEWKLRQRGSWG